MSTFAPIALFVFNRPLHLQNTLNALVKNPEFAESQLYIFSDGPRDEQDILQVNLVRKLVRTFEFSNATLIERNLNMGLAVSVVTGVTDLCDKFGRVIVLEDDLIVAKGFLNYMNRALDFYANQEKVMQISGYMFPVAYDGHSDASLLPISSTWGWATWKRAWDNFNPSLLKDDNFLSTRKERSLFNLDNSYPYTRRMERQRNGFSDSWGIQWYMSIFSLRGLVLYPPNTLVLNSGFDGTGTHCGIEESKHTTINFETLSISFPTVILINEVIFNQVKKFLKQENSLYRRMLVKINNFYKK